MMIDSACVRVHQHGDAVKGGVPTMAGIAAWDASEAGLTTKIHALVDADGRPVRLELTPGQAGDAPVAASLLACQVVAGPLRPSRPAVACGLGDEAGEQRAPAAPRATAGAAAQAAAAATTDPVRGRRSSGRPQRADADGGARALTALAASEAVR
jgi:hypothetical protein